MLLLPSAARAADDSAATLARLKDGHARAMTGGPRAARLARDGDNRPVVAVVMPADWAVSVADLLDLSPQEVLRIDADDVQRGQSVGEAVARLGVRLVVTLEPDAAAARSQAAAVRRESPAARDEGVRVEPARLDAASGRIEWLGSAANRPAPAVAAAAVGGAAATASSTAAPVGAVLGFFVAAGLLVWTNRPQWISTGRRFAEALGRDMARRLRDRLVPPRPAAEVEAAAEVDCIRRENPRLFAVLGRLQEAQCGDGAEPGFRIATDQPSAQLHALVAAERYIPAALAGGG